MESASDYSPSPYGEVIQHPGNYALTKSVTFSYSDVLTPPKNAGRGCLRTGILVASSHVTLDLAGWQISGEYTRWDTDEDFCLVRIADGVQNVCLRSGHLCACGFGVWVGAGCTDVRIESLSVFSFWKAGIVAARPCRLTLQRLFVGPSFGGVRGCEEAFFAGLYTRAGLCSEALGREAGKLWERSTQRGSRGGLHCGVALVGDGYVAEQVENAPSADSVTVKGLRIQGIIATMTGAIMHGRWNGRGVTLPATSYGTVAPVAWRLLRRIQRASGEDVLAPPRRVRSHITYAHGAPQSCCTMEEEDVVEVRGVAPAGDGLVGVASLLNCGFPVCVDRDYTLDVTQPSLDYSGGDPPTCDFVDFAPSKLAQKRVLELVSRAPASANEKEIEWARNLLAYQGAAGTGAAYPRPGGFPVLSRYGSVLPPYPCSPL